MAYWNRNSLNLLVPMTVVLEATSELDVSLVSSVMPSASLSTVLAPKLTPWNLLKL